MKNWAILLPAPSGVLLHPRGNAVALVLATALLASGCGQGADGVTGVRGGDAAGKTLFSGPMRAGLYRTVQTGDVEEESERCITAAQIASRTYLTPSEMPEGWSAMRNRLEGGVIDFEATGPSRGHMVHKGSYTADSFSIEATLAFERAGEIMRLDTGQRGTFISASCGDAG